MLRLAILLALLSTVALADITGPARVANGDTAAIHAAMRADAMLDKGDLDGYAVWRRIVRAVRGLLNREPVGAVH